MDHPADIPPEASGPRSGEASPDGRWVTYDELGRIRGIGRESAVKLAQRKRWGRIPGNDGVARVCVPPEWRLPAKEHSGDRSPERSPDTSPELSSAISVPEGAIVTLREQLEHANRRADRVENRVDQAENRAEQAVIRADRAEQAFADERNRADRAESGRETSAPAPMSCANASMTSAPKLSDAQVELAAAQDQAEAGRLQLEATQIAQAEAAADAAELRQAEAERRARGRLARVWRAWRGE
jgi:hypothetical protein